jgi:hypothetical protein
MLGWSEVGEEIIMKCSGTVERLLSGYETLFVMRITTMACRDCGITSTHRWLMQSQCMRCNA